MGATGTRLLLALGLAASGNAMAAGGHHGVDDATILPQGACDVESWYTRAHGGAHLMHAGFGCGTGLVELGAASEYAREGDRSATGWNLEAKWARELADGLSFGLDLQGAWVAHTRPRYAATLLSALATWSPRPDLAFHVNIGRKFVHGDEHLPRGGVAAEWSPLAQWSFVAERFVDDRTHYWRTGARWTPARSWTVDLTNAQRISGPAPSNLTLGLTWSLGSR